MIDMHSHILPGLDDGAADWEQAVEMARVAAGDGITGIVCTPHWVLGKYENNRDLILSRLAALKELTAAEGIPIEIYPGAEIRIDMSVLERIRTGELPTINNGSGYVLLELPEETIPDNIEEFFWNLQIAGFRPILSHVERNPLLRRHPGRLYDWVEAGILTQITAASLDDGFSEEIKEFAVLLLEHRLAHMLVTDSHGLRMRKPILSKARKKTEEILDREAAQRMVLDIPGHILRGEPVPAVDPVPIRNSGKKHFFRSLFSR